VDDVRVERGNPTAEEVAALVGVLLAAARRPGRHDAPRAASRWAHSSRPTVPLRAGPGAWRASALPR